MFQAMHEMLQCKDGLLLPIIISVVKAFEEWTALNEEFALQFGTDSVAWEKKKNIYILSRRKKEAKSLTWNCALCNCLHESANKSEFFHTFRSEFALQMKSVKIISNRRFLFILHRSSQRFRHCSWMICRAVAADLKRLRPLWSVSAWVRSRKPSRMTLCTPVSEKEKNND